jgi:uncharacterized spore protein YtfJ
MSIAGFVSQADQALHARRVFGDPIERNGLTVIPVARVAGGGGGAEGRMASQGADGAPEAPAGVSGGVGLFAQPAGVYVVKDDAVRWIPAVDVNRMIRGFTVVAVVLLLVVRSIARAQASAQRAR